MEKNKSYIVPVVYDGIVIVDASSPEDARNQVRSMSKKELIEHVSGTLDIDEPEVDE